jgi:alkanesulfonate monooxygenase SsuD/methylene tetrahydromethanopterin reductase-like flavin-dependent oxidoreductase (luciferase family)
MKLDLLYEIEAPMPWPDGQRKREQRAWKETLEQVELADKVGFNIVWMVEHHFRVERSHCSAPEVFLGAASQRTQNIHLGHGVALLPKPFNHPIRLAERAAALDILSDGRVEFGTGRSTLFEQDGFRVDVNEAVGMWKEALDMIPRMWTEEKFSYQGKYWEVPERNVLPKPVQEPHPPMWTAATQYERHTQAGEMGLGVLSFSPTHSNEEMAKRVALYREGLKRAKPVGKFVNDRFGGYTLVHVAETEKQAVENGALESVGWWYQHLGKATLEWEGALWSEEERRQRFPGLEKLAKGDFRPEDYVRDGMVMVGDPDHVIRLMELFEAAGVDDFLCYVHFGGLPHRHVMKSLELLGQYVIPHFAAREQKKPAATVSG